MIGKITVKMDSVSSSIKMEISMKVCGDRTLDMARAHIGETKVAN